MLPEEIIGSLKSLTSKHVVKISEIERECLIPKNSLASVITQKRAFPMKHKERLQEYCKAKEIGILLGSDKNEKLGNPPKKIFILHDITCSADPAKPMGTEGCSCEMYRRAKKAEKELETLTLEKEDLILKYGGIANELRKLRAEGQNKLDPAPKTEKEGKTTPNQEKGKEGAENSSKKGEQPPEGLTEIQLMVWKNEQKRKINPKAPPITGFGLTKKEKK